MAPMRALRPPRRQLLQGDWSRMRKWVAVFRPHSASQKTEPDHVHDFEWIRFKIIVIQAIPQGWKLQGWQLKAGHEKRSE
jgi:hypothetical protein